MADFNDDIDLCMDCCLDYFGDPAIYKPADSDKEYNLTAILDENVGVVDTSGEIPVETPMPVISVKLSDFDKLGVRHPQQDDQFVIKGKLYTVTKQPEDGWSESRIVLFCEGAYVS